MISANELMIGDWVKFTSKYGYGTGQVVGIEPLEGTAEPTTFTIWKRDKEGNTKFFVGVSKICVEPIPIAPEILEKNGFRKGCYVGGYYSPDCPFRVFVKTEGTCGFTTLFDDEIHFSCVFVHQLQQALRLCGIKKEIEI